MKKNKEKTDHPNTAMFRQAARAGEEYLEFFARGGKFEKHKNADKIIEMAKRYI